MVIFRENTEDVYAGIEWPANSPEAQRLINFLNEMGCFLDISAASASSRSPNAGPNGWYAWP